MANKRFKRNKRKSSKQIKRFKPATARGVGEIRYPVNLKVGGITSLSDLREKRLSAAKQEAENRYQYHQLRLLLNKKALLPIC